MFFFEKALNASQLVQGLTNWNHTLSNTLNSVMEVTVLKRESKQLPNQGYLSVCRAFTICSSLVFLLIESPFSPSQLLYRKIQCLLLKYLGYIFAEALCVFPHSYSSKRPFSHTTTPNTNQDPLFLPGKSALLCLTNSSKMSVMKSGGREIVISCLFCERMGFL